MVTVKINNVKLNLPNNTTILHACKQLGITIPTYCFSRNLEIAGNCRACLVEVKNSPKPVAACAMPITNGMEIFTDTPLVHKARESVAEFLLINHPLDCPICDQGGECDLQDQTLTYGSDRSRFFFFKRAVENKNFGPFIKTVMTRCIHCTRCVRFANDVCGVDNLGTTGRGNSTEISFYISKIFRSEYSGNVIDLCPVGALTSKPFSFKARSWELSKRQSVDILDGLGSNIVVQTFNNKIVRILPKINKNINIEWITNKTRFFFDSLKYQRIEQPLVKENDILVPTSWSTLFQKLNTRIQKIDGSRSKVLVGDFADLSALYWLKKTFNYLGVHQIEHTSNKLDISTDYPNNFLFKNKLLDLQKADTCLLINCDTRSEGSLLNIHLKNNVEKNNLKVYSIGKSVDLTFNVTNLGLTLQTLYDIVEDKHYFCETLSKSENTIIIVGSNTYQIKGINNLLDQLKGSVNILQNNVGFINFLEIFGNEKLEKKESLDLLFLYNTDLSNKELDKIKENNDNLFIVYIGHHFTDNAQQADLIVPCSTFFEKSANSLNILGMIQKTTPVLKKRSSVKSDTKIFKNLLLYISKQNGDSLNFSKKTSYKRLHNYLEKTKLQLIDDDFKSFSDPIISVNKNIHFKGTNLSLFKRNNILEKYSKVLTNSLSLFKKPSNF